MSTLLLFSLFSFLVFFFFMGIRVVSQQTIKIVETFGKYSRTLTPGINFIFYPIQAIAGTVSLKIETIKAVVEIKTSDNMFVKLPIDLMVSVNPDKANDAFYRLQDPHAQISSWVLNTVRSTAATMTLEEMYQDKETIVASVRGTLSAKLDEFGYKIENVLVDQPTVTRLALITPTSAQPTSAMTTGAMVLMVSARAAASTATKATKRICKH